MPDAAVDWSDANIAILEKGVREGLSYSQIAKLIPNCSKMAALGKAWRMGLRPLPKPSPPARVLKAPRPARSAAATSAPRRIAEPNTLAVLPTPVRYVDEMPGAATVLTLGAHMCKWPIGDPALNDFTYCGRRKERGSYCGEHAQIAYQAPQGKKTSAAELARSLRRYL